MARTIVGERYGALTVISDSWIERPAPRRSRRKVEVRCDCGTVKAVNETDMIAGKVGSCGCQKGRRIVAARGTHGMSKSLIYRCWCNMKTRSTGSYPLGNYENVGRDPRWDSFDEFLADMGDSYFPGAMLSRIGDVGDYTKDNCRWLTKSENAREMAERRMIRTDDGRLALDVARENGVRGRNFTNRLHMGWTVEDAMTRPVRKLTRRA